MSGLWQQLCQWAAQLSTMYSLQLQATVMSDIGVELKRDTNK